MHSRNVATRGWRVLWLLPVFVLGMITLIGSETFEDDDTPPTPPVTTNFVIGSGTGGFEYDRGVDVATVSDIRLSGDYSADADSEPSLNRDFANVDTLTSFTVDVTPADPDAAGALSGIVTLTVNEPIDFGIGRDPENGRFSTVFMDTTTIVRAGPDLSGVGITVGGGSEQNLSWDDFRGALDDDNDPLDIRMASYAYAQITALFEAALVAEQAHLDVQDNRGDLEGMNIGEALRLTCDTAVGGTAGERDLVWRTDAAGSGQGTAGDGDTFEEQLANCFFNGTGFFLDGGVQLSDYQYDGTQPKRLAFDIDISTLFIGSEEIDRLTQPAPDQPRLNGQLRLDYQQEAADSTD